MMRRLCCVCLLLLVCSGCATLSLHHAADRWIFYWGGAGDPQAFVTDQGDVRVFEMGRYGFGRARDDPRPSWYRIDLPLSYVLRSLTNGQASVVLRIHPKSDDLPDSSTLSASGCRSIPVRLIKLKPDAMLPADALTAPSFEREGTNFVPRYVWMWTHAPASALVAYLERHPPDTTALQELLYLEDYQRHCWILYERDGLLNGSHFVVIFWKYPPARKRWYLYSFTPVTVAFDIVTFPVQAVLLLIYAGELIRM